MHGPGPPTDTNPLGWEPLWNGSSIPVIDDVCLLLPERRWAWKKARNRAITMLEDSTGLTFNVVVGPGYIYEGNLPWSIATSYWDLLPHLGPDTIRLVATPAGTVEWGWYMNLWIGGVYHPAGAIGMAWNTLEGEWLKKYMRPQLAATIAHEIGHVLGLWHRKGGIMSGAYRLDDHDRDSLRDYYT